MPYDPTAFPQDESTGLEDTIDWNDAGGFAWLAHHPNTTGHVVEGFEFDVDWANNLLTVHGGVAELYQESTWTNDHTDEGGDPEKELGHVSFRVQRGPSGDRNLIDGEVNYIYLGLDQTENNTVFFQDNTTKTPPPDPYLLLGTVDTTDDTAVLMNRSPTMTAERMLITREVE